MDDISKNLNNLMKEAQKMQKRMQKAQEQLSELIVIGESGGGMVTVKMNGRHEVLEVKIKPSLMGEGADEEAVGLLEDLVAAAVRKAVLEVEKLSKEKISQLTSDLNIPTDFMDDDTRDD